VISGENVAMKIGGFVKADFIYDFNPIDSTDTFDTTTIPVDAPPRTNSRFHARQTRLSFDTHWMASERTVRIFVEGDFFSDNDRYRLRHAYGEVGALLVGQTWTTFTDVAAAPATLDFEGSVSSVNRRQAQARWTESVLHEDVTLALAVEDSREIIQLPTGLTGDPRTPSPDFVARVRFEREWGQFQVAGLYRVLGFQPKGADLITGNGWGLNFTEVILLTDSTKVYSQIVFGQGIGSYRSLPDVVPSGPEALEILGILGWMIGVTHEWTDLLSSNFVRRTTYLAANLIWKPLERVTVGAEYLHGLRENVDLHSAAANRLQVAFIFDLP
jgi:hypothetical protein